MLRIMILTTGLAAMGVVFFVMADSSLPQSAGAEEPESVQNAVAQRHPVGPTGWGSGMMEYRVRLVGRQIGRKRD